jgi:uncharacterized SAM-binding protein YcdF (DUF218 family)
MSFALKKLLGSLLSPMVGGMLFLLAALALSFTVRFGRAGRILLALGLVVAYLLGTGPVARALIAPLEGAYSAVPDPAALEGEVRWIVVLGGSYTFDERVVPAARLGSGSLYRLVEGVRLARALPGATLVFSGYGGRQERTNAEGYLDAALQLGVDPSTVRLLTDPRDTGEEAERVAALLTPGERFLLVTSAAHMPRAMYHFRARGVHPIPAPAEARALGPGVLGPRDFFPRDANYVTVGSAVHEWLGLVWARITLGALEPLAPGSP